MSERVRVCKWMKEPAKKRRNCAKKMKKQNLPIILENEARVLNGACGASSMPLSSWMRFSASRSKLFKWFPNESVDLTKNENVTQWQQIENMFTIKINS